MTVGQVYEITPYIQISWNGAPPIGTYYAKCIGFNSKDEPVFENNGNYFVAKEDTAKIVELNNTINTKTSL
jgi:hypothetical protein